MLNGATLDGQPHLLEFLIGNSKWLTTNNPFQCISFEHVQVNIWTLKWDFSYAVGKARPSLGQNK